MITQVVKLSVKQSSGEKYKRTQQGASTKLESYLYCYILVCATTSCLSHILLKVTMLHSYDVISCDISCDCSVTCLFIVQNQKGKQNKINIKSETLDKRKEKLFMSKVFHNIHTIKLVIISKGQWYASSK